MFPARAFFKSQNSKCEEMNFKGVEVCEYWQRVENAMLGMGPTPVNASPASSGDGQHRGRQGLCTHVEDGTEYSPFGAVALFFSNSSPPEDGQ